MVIAELPFEQFNILLQNSAKREEFELIVYLVARNADAPRLFSEIEENWSSLHDVTGDKILFVLVNGQAYSKEICMTQIEGGSGFFLYSPSCRITSPLETPVRYGSYLEKYIVPFNVRQESERWKQNHSISMTEVATSLNLTENQIPCLNFFIVSTHKNVSFPLRQISPFFSVYKFLKKIKEENNFFGKKKYFENRDSFVSSNKAKRYATYSQTLNNAINEIEIDSPTKSWIEQVLKLNIKHENVFQKVEHIQDKFKSSSDFTKFRAALNSFVAMAENKELKEKLDFQEHGNKTFYDYANEFTLLLEKSFHHDYSRD